MDEKHTMDKCKEIENRSESDWVLDIEGSESHIYGGGEAAIHTSSSSSSSSARAFRPIPAFLQKLYDILEKDEYNPLVSWSCSGTSFVVNNPHSFAACVLPTYFKHSNFQSFISQLNSYGFKKVSWEQWEYKNEHFRRGEKSLLRNIKRKEHCCMRSPSSEMETSLACNTDKEVISVLMKEHGRMKGEIMKLKEKQHCFQEKLLSLESQAISNREKQKRLMVVAERIMKNDGTAMADQVDEKKGKRKLENGLTGDEVIIAKHNTDTYVSFEDLFGDSYWVDHDHDKAKHLKS